MNQVLKSINITNAKKAVLAITGLTDEQYNAFMYESGLHFADGFSKLLADPAYTYKQLTQAIPAKAEDKNNYFWSWWHFNWLLTDKMWYDSKVYAQQISYEQYKTYMIGDEALETQLLQDLANEKL